VGQPFARVLILSILLAATAAAQSFEKQARFPLAAGKRLRVSMGVGELRIQGGSQPEVRVLLHVTVRRGPVDEIERDVQIRFQPGENEAELEIVGLKEHESPLRKIQVRAEITIPSETHLSTELGVGSLRIENVAGDLRAKLGVGEIRVELANPELYRSVHASVGIGDLRHQPFPGRATGWLGKKYEASFNRGRYRLEANVGVGDIRISESRTI